jgi:hypothetical protein
MRSTRFGWLFERTALKRDALRPLTDSWCRLSEGELDRAGAVVRPLRAAAVMWFALVSDDDDARLRRALTRGAIHARHVEFLWLL